MIKGKNWRITHKLHTKNLHSLNFWARCSCSYTVYLFTRLINKLQPGSIPKVNHSTLNWHKVVCIGYQQCLNLEASLMPLLVCIVVMTWTSLLCFEIETLSHICAILRMQLMFVTNIMSLVDVLDAMVCAKKCRECRCVQSLALSAVRI